MAAKILDAKPGLGPNGINKYTMNIPCSISSLLATINSVRTTRLEKEEQKLLLKHCQKKRNCNRGKGF